MIVIGAVGLNGSGKDALIEYLHERHGIPVLSMGDLVREMAAQRGMRPTRSNLHEVSQQAIEQHGADFFAEKLIAQIEDKPWGVVGITGIRTPADVRAFRKRFGNDFILVYVRVSDAHTRFERVQRRDEARDPQSYDKFLEQDREEMEIFQIEETIKKADITIDNGSSLREFYHKIEKHVAKPVLDTSEQNSRKRKGGMMDTKEAYQERAEAQLKALEARIELMEAQAEKAKAEAKVEYGRQLEDLRQKRKEAEERLEGLKVAGTEAWRELMTGVDEAMTALESAVNSAAARFD